MLIAILFAIALCCTVLNIQLFIVSLMLFAYSPDKLKHKDKYKSTRTPFLLIGCICWAAFYYLTH